MKLRTNRYDLRPVVWLLGTVFVMAVAFVDAPWVPPKAPITFPINLSKLGEVAEFEFRAMEDRVYDVGLLYVYRTDEQRERMFELATGRIFPTAKPSKQYPAEGVLTPMHIQIWAYQADHRFKLIEEKMAVGKGLVSHGGDPPDTLYRWVSKFSLGKGRYRIVVRSTEDIPELNNAELQVVVGRRYKV